MSRRERPGKATRAKPDRKHGPAPAGIIIPDHRAPMRILLTPPQAVGPIIPIGDRS